LQLLFVFDKYKKTKVNSITSLLNKHKLQEWKQGKVISDDEKRAFDFKTSWGSCHSYICKFTCLDMSLISLLKHACLVEWKV